MLTKENNKQKITKLKSASDNLKLKKKKEHAIEESLKTIKNDFLTLFQHNSLSKDIKFLRKMAINIKQVHFDAKDAKQIPALKQRAQAVEHFLSTPIGAPFIGSITLNEAADTFSEQNPKESDLSQLLGDFATFGKHYATQLLRVFLL